MVRRYRDPRFVLALVAFSPFVCWMGGAAGIWVFRKQWWAVGLSIGAILVGFRLAVVLHRIINSLYGAAFRPALARVPFNDWIAVDLEKTGTQDTFHFFPNTVGVVIRRGAACELVKLNGEVVALDAANWLFKNISKTSYGCSILVTDGKGIDMLGFVLSPKYKGNDLEIAGHSNLRAQWFLEWLMVGVAAGAKPHS